MQVKTPTADAPRSPCPACNGTKTVKTETKDAGGVVVTKEVTCYACKGTGFRSLVTK